jgi:Flp pilus assembly protein TadD
MLVMRLLAASALSLAAASALAATAPASTPATTPSPTAAAPAAAQKPAPPPKPLPATPEERAMVERMEPLSRAAFWAHEVDNFPMDYDARLKLAKAMRALGRYEDAGAAADQLLVLQPSNLEALLESARDKVAANQGFYAVDLAQRAEALAPRDWRPVSLMAVALEQSGRESDALAAHRKALALAPDNPATLTNLGMYLAVHGDAAGAEPLLRKAVAAPGASAQERQNLALVLGLQGKFDEAERLARQDLPPDVVQNNLAYLHADANGAQPRTWDSVRQSQ